MIPDPVSAIGPRPATASSSPRPPSAAHAVAPHPQQSGAGVDAPRRVLVVEDNPDGLETLMALLTMLGHEVSGAADGGRAVEQALAFQPDVVLLDLGLPVLDGFEVARKLRQDPRSAGVFIAALTGWGAEGDRQRTAEAGFDAHLTKPVELDALEAVLGRSSVRGKR